jgi:uncharacterized protein (DUF1499 family)
MPGFVDFQTMKRRSTPNTALFAPAGFTPSAKPDAAAPLYDVAPGDLYLRLLRLIGERKAWQLGEQDAGGLRVTFVAVTALFRFKDDVGVQILPVEGQPGKSTFAAYSRSRIGRSDLGANRKRLDELASALMAP